MTLLDHWPVAATVGWVLLGAWLIKKAREARMPLPSGVGENFSRAAWRRFGQNSAAKFGAFVMFTMVILCVIGPWIMEVAYGITYRTGDTSQYSDLPPLWWKWLGYEAREFAPWTYPFGTNDNAHNLLVHVLGGGRVSISVGIITATMALGIGVIYGATAGYIGGRIDSAMMRFVEVLYSLPYMIFVIIIMSLFGYNIVILFVAIGFVAWLTLARIVRDQVLALKHKEFVEAAIATGTPTWKVITRHLVPNSFGPVIVYTTMLVPRIILEEAFLSFIGFGIKPPFSSWGTLIYQSMEGRNYQYSPWTLIFPIVFMIPTLYALNFIGDGLRDAFDPRAKSFQAKHKRKSATRKLLETVAAIVFGNWATRFFKPDFETAERPTSGDPGNVLEVAGLEIRFETESGKDVCAVNGFSLTMTRGEVVAIVGESGSGKTAVAKALMGLHPSPSCFIPAGTARISGGKNLFRLTEKELCGVRGARMAMVFQDPMTSLNPYFSVRTQIVEALRVHSRTSKKEARLQALEMLRRVGIPDPERRINDYPHELSGGMRQRVMIAIALITKPDIIIADEPTTALDVTIQAQILDLLRQLKGQGTVIIFITHDLGIVGEMADRVAVMYAGRVVECGSVRDVLKNPQHPYTQALLASRPRLDAKGRALTAIEGQPPDPRELPQGCAFAPRCPHVHEGCLPEFPAERVISASHVMRCVRREVAA